MDLQVAAAVLATVFVSVILYLRWRAQYWKRRKVFTLQKNTLLGLQMKINLGFEFQKLYNEVKSRGLRYGGHYGLLTPQFVPVDINLVRRILTTDFQHFTDHSELSNEENDPLNEHLFSLRGAKWKALRIKLTPTFTTGKLKMMFETLVNCSKDLPVVLEQAVRDATPIDIKETFALYTVDVIASIGFGIESNCLKDPDAEFRKIGKLMAKTTIVDVIKMILYALTPKVFKMLKLSLTKKEIERFIMKIVKETADYRDKNNFRRKDFMQLLLDLRNEVLKVDTMPEDDDLSKESVSFYQNGLSITEIAAQAFVFYIAGFETSSTTLNFLMYELATNPNIQEKLRKEVNDVLKKHDGKVTYEAVSEMEYLERCILESLRKYPPLTIIFRVCTKEYTVPDSDLVINKGDGVVIPAYAIHYDPEFYPEPDKFDPDRFTEENKNLRPQGTFLAFGDGPRICIGSRLGLLQTKVGLISIMRDFRFTLNPKTKTPLEFDTMEFILHAKGGIWIDAHRL